MFTEGTQIKKKVDVQSFKVLIKKYSLNSIECTPHTFFRLSQAQRKVYTCDELKNKLTTQAPFLVGLQNNGNYALFYKHQNKNFKMIVRIGDRKVNIVTFYFIQEWQIPKI